MDDNLRTQPKDSWERWEHLSKFKEDDYSLAWLSTIKKITGLEFTAEAFACHFCPLFDPSYPIDIQNNARFTLSDLLNMHFACFITDNLFSWSALQRRSADTQDILDIIRLSVFI
jgi:hypothetical protein